jgi:hypothetical protein
MKRLPKQFDAPLMSIASIGSWWAGVRGDHDTMHLGDIEYLLNHKKIRFLAQSAEQKQLMLDLSGYQDTVVYAVGAATLSLVQTRRAVKLMKISLSGALDDLSDLDIAVGRK